MIDISRQTQGNVNLLVAELIRVKVGDTITYEQLQEAIGIDLRKKGRGALSAALRRVERDYQIVFDVIPGAGYVHIDSGLRVKKAERKNRGIFRAAKRTSVILASANHDDLTPEERARALALQCASGSVLVAIAPKTIEAQTRLYLNSPAQPMIPKNLK
jgi:hypothetical protein